jgi:3'-phosphoadenosine 5'-phosphosulfate (PAPS) 3'-phosphatase
MGRIVTSVVALPLSLSWFGGHSILVVDQREESPEGSSVASGVLDASVFFGGGPWDVAARAVICQEAGGRYTDLWGGSRLDTQTAIVTNGLIMTSFSTR